MINSLHEILPTMNAIKAEEAQIIDHFNREVGVDLTSSGFVDGETLHRIFRKGWALGKVSGLNMSLGIKKGQS